MNEDHEILPEVYKPIDKKETKKDTFHYLDTRDNSEEAILINQMLAEIDREEALIKRQDVIEYKLNLSYVARAISIILFILMMINGFVFLILKFQFNSVDNLPMIMFTEAGICFVITSIMIPRKTHTVNRSYRMKQISEHRRNIRFAFTHSLTWLICAGCMIVFSVISYYSIN